MHSKIIIAAAFIIMTTAMVFAFSTSKPETHNSAWMDLHGKQANINSQECYDCHTDKLECITCHEDTKPRNHTLSWTNKLHGLEVKWGRSNCKTCHTEDSCISCHESTKPANHTSHYVDVHCNVGCQQPIGVWENTISKDCLVCHRAKPTPEHPKPY